jgi:hypothetical protein
MAMVMKVKTSATCTSWRRRMREMSAWCVVWEFNKERE